MTHRTCRGSIAKVLGPLVVLAFTASCGGRPADDISAASTSSTLVSANTSGSTQTLQIATSTTVDPLEPTTLPFDPSIPPCSDEVPNLFLIPTGDVSVVHLTLKISDGGVTGRTDSGNSVLNAALAIGDDCQLDDRSSQRVVAPGRAPRWDVLSVDGTLPGPDAGLDFAHLTGRNETTLVFYNCVGSDPTLSLADILATIVATSSLTCRSSPSVYAA